MRRLTFLIIMTIVLMIAVGLSLGIKFSLAAQTDSCNLAPRLVVGQQGRVLSDAIVNVRSEPTTTVARLGYAPSGVHFIVLEGSLCVEGFHWWQVEFAAADVVTEAETEATSLIGWVAEGNPADGEYWLEPRGERVLIENADGIEIAYIRDTEGNLEREGCLKPPEDYARIQQGYATLNVRTIAMLDHAQRLYEEAGGGVVNFRQAITQGGYNPGGLAASFGTHDGGGAVDISVRSIVDYSVLTGEIMPMLDALRVAGFAAWLRDVGELYPDSPIHIHAIAVGDAELSAAAREQIDGQYGYLRGYNGLPEDYGGPALDIYSDPVICRWMVEIGFDDLREGVTAEATPEATETP